MFSISIICCLRRLCSRCRFHSACILLTVKNSKPCSSRSQRSGLFNVFICYGFLALHMTRRLEEDLCTHKKHTNRHNNYWSRIICDPNYLNEEFEIRIAKLVEYNYYYMFARQTASRLWCYLRFYLNVLMVGKRLNYKFCVGESQSPSPNASIN